MTNVADDPDALLSLAIGRYAAVYGVEFTGMRLAEALAVLRHQATVNRIHDRILLARHDINAAAVERFEVHDDEAAEAIMDQPTPEYPGAYGDDMWLRTNAGYGVQEGGQLMRKPKEAPVPIKEDPQANPRGNTVSRLQGDAKRATLPEPDATAAVLLAALLDDPVRIDAHLETLAGLPCGGFNAVRDLILELPDGPEGPTSHPLVDQMRRTLNMRPGVMGYTPEGWERAARALVARWG